MPSSPKLRAACLCFAFFASFSPEGTTMSIFSRPTQELVICSEMQGKLTYKGKPAAGAKMVRWFAWKDHEGESETFFADEYGNFLLPEKREVVKKGFFHFLFQFVGKQLVTVTYQGADYEIWYTSKFEPVQYTEYGGVPTNLRCELTDEQEVFRTDHILGGASCKWDVISE